jgi:outer membrane protein assembly factor BamB
MMFRIMLMLCAVWGLAVGSAEVTFESLGAPSKPKEVGAFQFITTDAACDSTIWGMRDIGSACAMVGVNARTGRSTVFDFTRYGRAKMAPAPNGGIYIHAAGPAGGRFFKYDPATGKLSDLGQSSKTATYMLATLMTADGVFYAPTYPGTELNAIDTATDTVLKSVAIADDERQKYINAIEQDADGVLYVRLGLRHPEIWSYRPATGEKQQLLPEAVIGRIKPTDVGVVKGGDGRVYLQIEQDIFRCRADRLEKADEIPPPAKRPALVTADGLTPLRINSDGELELTAAPPQKGAPVTKVKTDVPPIHPSIYSVSCERDGWIYGGTLLPAATFRYRPATGEMQDLGRLGGGGIQVYDLINLPGGILLSSYTGGNLDFYHPESGKKKPVRNLTASSGQERVPGFALAANGKVYGGTIPVKAKLGGAIVEIDPETLQVREWANVAPKQSIPCVAPVKDQPLVFAGSTIGGGSSAIPEAAEAVVLLFDPASGKTVWEGKPLSGETNYNYAAATPAGLICGLGDRTRRYYLFDPVARRVLATGDLPPTEGRVRLCRQTAPDGRVIGIAGDQLFAIDPVAHRLDVLGRHPSLTKIIYHVWLSPAGTLYYGAEGELWKAQLPASTQP